MRAQHQQQRERHPTRTRNQGDVDGSADEADPSSAIRRQQRRQRRVSIVVVVMTTMAMAVIVSSSSSHVSAFSSNHRLLSHALRYRTSSSSSSSSSRRRQHRTTTDVMMTVTLPDQDVGRSTSKRGAKQTQGSSSTSSSSSRPRRVPPATTTTTSTTSPAPSRQQQRQQHRDDDDDVDDSPRLKKAKLLLDELTSQPNDDDAAMMMMGDGDDDDDSERRQSDSDNDKGVVSIRDNKNDNDMTTTTVVPDTFWRNGHLQGDGYSTSSSGGSTTASGKKTRAQDYVTRWARGVKVAEPLVKYDPVAAEQLLFRQPRKWLLRNFQIAWPLGWWAFGVVWDFVSSQTSNMMTINSNSNNNGPNDAPDTEEEMDERQRQQARNRRYRAQQLRRAITDLGPAIIKGGQALASRPDLLPSDYLEELQKLQDEVPTFSNQVAFDIVEQELGMDFDEVFELVEQEPVAAASIGQVYKARLRANGDTIALKIQRPRCEEIIALDLYVLRWWCGVYNRIFQILQRDVDLQSVIDDFGELIYREIDYVAEAANAQRFNELYAGVADVFVPKIYSDLTTSKVLTMEWVDGCRLTDKAALQQYGIDESKLVDTLVECSLRQILENGFFHADPHAGNLLATQNKQLAFLDFGMVSYADTKQRNGFLLAVVHIVNRDWDELTKVYQTLGFIPEGTDLQPIQDALEQVMPNVLDSSIEEVNFKNIVNKLGDIFYTYPFSLPPFYIAIIRCLGVLEGLAIQVDPKAQIISKAYPYVASRVLTDSQPELQEALRRLALTNDGHVRWNRLEELLDEAKESSEYDVSAALDMLTDYLLSDEGDQLLQELSQQIVDAADSLGSESLQYVLDASRALAINDEVAAVRAFRSIQGIFASAQEDLVASGGDNIVNGGSSSGFNNVRKRVGEDLQDVLPEPTPAMKQFGRILTLLGAAQDNSNNGSTSSEASSSSRQGSSTDYAKFVPIARKLAGQPRIQRTANEIIARIGERMLSRGLRAAFGLPPPTFGKKSAATTVTEDLNT